ILRMDSRERELSGGEPATTNNRMELMAVISGLEARRRRCTVRFSPDGAYVLAGATKWINGCKKNGWRTADKKPVKNVELWQRLGSPPQIPPGGRHLGKGHPRADRQQAPA